MNARQKVKKYKKKISDIESDNNLMREIIADHTAMQELYDAYNKPKFVTHTTMQFQEFRAKRMVPFNMRDLKFHIIDLDDVIECAKRAAAEDLLEEIKDYITYKVNTDYMKTTVTASIFIGREE